MPVIMKDGVVYSLSVEEFNAVQDAELENTHLPISSGKLTGTDTSTTFTGHDGNSYSLDAGSVLMWGKAYTDNDGNEHSIGDILRFDGVKVDGLETAHVKTWQRSPSRSSAGALSDINQIRNYIVPRCKITFSLFTMADYAKLINLFKTYNEFYVYAFYKETGIWETYLMYETEGDLSVLYGLPYSNIYSGGSYGSFNGFTALGIQDYSIELVATLNDTSSYSEITLSETSYSYNATVGDSSTTVTISVSGGSGDISVSPLIGDNFSVSFDSTTNIITLVMAGNAAESNTYTISVTDGTSTAEFTLSITVLEKGYTVMFSTSYTTPTVQITYNDGTTATVSGYDSWDNVVYITFTALATHNDYYSYTLYNTSTGATISASNWYNSISSSSKPTTGVQYKLLADFEISE